MIYKKCGDYVCECGACEEECEELYIAFSDPELWVCEKCLADDFAMALEDWKGSHLVDLEAHYEEEDEQNAIDTEEQYRDMREDD